MNNIIKNFYNKLKQNYLGEKAKLVPEEFHSNFVCYGGASEAQYIIGTMVPESARKVLIVGVYGGRDYFYFKLHGYETYAVDLKDDTRYEKLLVANIEENLPYPDKFFDAIILSEVLEHLQKDFLALIGLKRLLKDDGVLVLSIPFLHDDEPTHLRVHTPLTVTRLLNSTGWKVKKMIERPGLGFWLIPIKIFNLLNHFINMIFYLITKRTIYSKILPIVWNIEYFAGQVKLPWRRFSKSWGGYLECYKSSEVYDYLNMNIKSF